MVVMATSRRITIPEWANASTSGNPMEDVFCTACLWITGPVGRAIATICIAITGLGAVLGKFTWPLAMLVGANVATVLGAANLVDSLAAGAPMNQCDSSILNNLPWNGWTPASGVPMSPTR